ncbi:MAG: GNAT family N-acetyltransferase, partial [Chloroflexi bacterium]|nr:GNAT family N-acetyltransferase [Chloroflexota bacterium]
VVEEACVNVIEHGFDPHEQGFFDVAILRKPGQIVVAVEDQGLPFDFRRVGAGEESDLGIVLMKAFADEVHFLNLGRGGKRVELVKNLTYKDVEAYVSEEEKASRSSTPAAAPPDTPLVLRLMKPDDLVGLARCVYRSYGYTYGRDYIYFPDRVRELMESGRLISSVAVAPDGEIVGHLGMSLRHLDARVGETGQAVVDPRCRGRGLFEEMKKHLMGWGRGRGMYGVYSESVTVHPYSQKGNLSLGAYETGILLGYTPGTMTFKAIQQESQNRRQAAVLFYAKINQEPARDLYAPFHHQTMIRRIYERSNLKRSFCGRNQVTAPSGVPTGSRVDVEVVPEPAVAFMNVAQFGAALPELVQFRLRELCLRRIDCIHQGCL